MTLPHDIWVHVSQFLPALLLRDLLSVNHSFFEIAMDCRYRQLIFAYLDDRMLKNMARLRDPAVAKRVRILHIEPSFLNLTDSAPLYFTPSKQQETTLPKHRSLRSMLTDIANLLLEQKNFSRHPKYRIMQALKKREDVVQVLSEVLSGLPNVKDYYVSWTGLPLASPTLSTFLTSPFQLKLRKLSLNVSLDNVPSLMTPESSLPQLEELHLCIHSETVADKLQAANILRRYLAPVISRLRSTLKTFVISAWEATDLSPLFANLAQFPLLDDLSINIPVEPCHLGHPSGTNGFLAKHQSSLRCLRLRPTLYGGKGLAANLFSFHDWILAATAGISFTKLRVLDMTSSLFPTDTSLMCLQRFSRTLTSLSLTGVYRTYEDVFDMLEMATKNSSCGLTHLRIGPVGLCPELIDLMASKLPSLQRLEISARDIYPSLPDADITKFSKTAQIESFFTAMESRSYTSWKLQSLSIVADVLPENDPFEAALEQTFFQCVPSLRFFT
ncbi:hypothetical protein FA15DRAFT_672223 [Coprinopsis marcescibilis]|uniref:F-box domain-containing protein n=1 Tax=Coprinopsis marcescibilis TaxID=230819 RepID=A0A5C3KPF8_COPMA|nr:hypothetical protein FA15DRAFT_672223 [Coprinopsis marcescibilis]